MKRLWVQQSLAFLSIILLMLLTPVLFRVLSLADGQRPPTFVEQIPELQGRLEGIPPEVLAQIEQEAQRNFFAGVIIFLLAGGGVSLVAGVLVSRRLTAPLDELARGAKAIEAQQFAYRVPVAGSQEIAEVGQAFNNMAGRLEKAETLRRNLLADVAHELRNPLHVLQGNLQAILDGVYPLETEEIGRLLAHTQHLNNLVNDLHELAQAEARQLPLQMNQVAVAELVKETAAVFQPSAVAKGITLQVELLGKLPLITADALRLRQVVSNLFNNALYHTPAGGHVLASVEEKGDVVQIQVQDSGAGIAAEELPYVFDRFYRANKARPREYGHTGLGLAIVKAIVEAHGGHITAASAGHGHGSTFLITLPNHNQTA